MAITECTLAGIDRLWRERGGKMYRLPISPTVWVDGCPVLVRMIPKGLFEEPIYISLLHANVYSDGERHRGWIVVKDNQMDSLFDGVPTEVYLVEDDSLSVVIPDLIETEGCLPVDESWTCGVSDKRVGE